MTDHYFSENPGSEFRIGKIAQKISKMDFEFFTSPGIFSKSRIDKGTLLLAQSMQVQDNDKVLDVGCGIGVLAIAAARLFGATVTLTDINRRAVILARKNLDLNKVKGKVFQGNLYEKISGKFDVVLSNPPQNAGRQACFDIIDGSKEFLVEGGTLQIVARPNRGGKVLAEKMRQVLGNVETIAKESGYAVYLSVNAKL